MEPSQMMQFKQVTVVGLGLIGGSIAMDLKKLKLAERVVGVENNRSHALQAVESQLVDAIETLDSAVRASDLVVLATPVDKIASLLPQVLDNLSENAVVTDMGSTKQLICQIASQHAKRAQYVSAHPMAGTENSGPGAALLGLFENKTAVICDADHSSDAALKTVQAVFSALKLRMIYMSAADHDLHVAYVSHLSHVSSFVLANTVLDIQKDVSAIFNLAGGGFESTVRLAKSSPEMWTPIFEQNRENISRALTAYIEHLARFHRSLVEEKWDQSRQLMNNANQIRHVLGAWAKKSPGQG
jgi:prephenate dehydrogenase